MVNAREAALKIDEMVEELTGQRVFVQGNPVDGRNEWTEAGRELFQLLIDLEGPLAADVDPDKTSGLISLGNGEYRLWSKRRSAVTGRFDRVEPDAEEDDGYVDQVAECPEHDCCDGGCGIIYYSCKHCGRRIDSEDNKWWVHSEGGYRGKARCDPLDSGLVYGYNADPEGWSCNPICLGD